MGDRQSTPSLPEGHPVRLAAANLALLATVLAFLVVSIRALVVARLDLATALGLVGSSGPVDVFVGTLTTDLPEFLLAVLAAAAFLRLLREGRRSATLDYFDVFLGIVAVVFFFTASWIYFMALGLVVAQAKFLPTDDVPTSWVRWVPLVAAGLIGALAGGLFLFSTAVWLPQEELHIVGSGAVHGYVLEEDGEWLSILLEDERELLLVEASDVQSRRVCASEDPSPPSLLQVVTEVVADAPSQPEYPQCGR